MLSTPTLRKRPMPTSPSTSARRVGEPHRLILMLYEGALLSLMLTEQCMKDGRGRRARRGRFKAISIIGEGLRLAQRQSGGASWRDASMRSYDYMVRRLVEANTENRPAPYRVSDCCGS